VASGPMFVELTVSILPSGDSDHVVRSVATPERLTAISIDRSFTSLPALAVPVIVARPSTSAGFPSNVGATDRPPLIRHA
jgi:hypothetical protein